MIDAGLPPSDCESSQIHMPRPLNGELWAWAEETDDRLARCFAGAGPTDAPPDVASAGAGIPITSASATASPLLERSDTRSNRRARADGLQVALRCGCYCVWTICPASFTYDCAGVFEIVTANVPQGVRPHWLAPPASTVLALPYWPAAISQATL